MQLGLDIGSSAVKGILLDAERGVLASAELPVELHSARPGWAEADPEQWWRAICALAPELLAQAGAVAAEVDAVAACGMVPAVLALDRSGQPLRRAILQNDARAAHELQELTSELADLDVLALTGSALTQQSLAPTLRWLERHEPDLFAGTEKVAGSYDWIARRLGAEPHVERNWALESGLFELDGEPLSQLLQRAGIDESLLCPVRAPGEVVGEVGGRAAEETGLEAGTPIVVGGADHVSSAYGAGVIEPGDWLVKLGGAGDILVVTEQPFLDARLYLDAHQIPGRWLPNGCMATSGSLTRWLAGVLDAPLPTLEAEAQRIPAGAERLICLPYFLGEKSPIHDPSLRGVFAGLHLGHTRAHLFRAALESVAFAFRHHRDVFVERGVSLGQARVTNGGSRSPLWKQILADVLGEDLLPVRAHPGASLGAALAGAVGVGAVGGWREVQRLVQLEQPVQPDPAREALYDELYTIYRELGPALAPFSHRLAGEQGR
ncbi:MAG: FGGY-family carbohydrate kinase [Solirubrobacteraceae bacterium]